MQPAEDADRRLLSIAGTWRATPDDYSSLHSLWLTSDGKGELIYGYGQTIYIVVPCRWEIPTIGRLRFTYAAPTRGRLAAGFQLTDLNRVQELAYTLTIGPVSGIESVVRIPYQFTHTLELSSSPWPIGLTFPYEVPRIFYRTVKVSTDSDGNAAD